MDFFYVVKGTVTILLKFLLHHISILAIKYHPKCPPKMISCSEWQQVSDHTPKLPFNTVRRTEYFPLILVQRAKLQLSALVNRPERRGGRGSLIIFNF